MTVRLLIVIAVLSTALAVLARDQTTGAMAAPDVRVSIVPGVSLPRAEELTAKLQNQLRLPAGTRAYVLEKDKWVEVKPSPMAKQLNAVVRSYNPKDGVAYVHLSYPEYNMPLVQIWRFNGKAWSDSIDPGILIR